MTGKPNDDFITARHSRLLTIATLANFFGWVILLTDAIFVLAGLLNDQKLFALLSPQYLQRSGIWAVMQNIWNLLTQNQFEGARIALTGLRTILQGLAAFLVLKGLSLGLRMIVETDLNYKEKYQRDAHEK